MMSRVASTAAATLAAVALAACSDAPVQPSTSTAPQPVVARGRASTDAIVPGEVIVKLREDAGLDVASFARANGLSLNRQGYARAFAVLRGAAGSEAALARRLAADPRVEYAEPNYLRQPTVDSRLWAFYNPGGLEVFFCCGDSRTGQSVGSYLSTLDADQDNVDGYASGGGLVVIGSIDTGVDFNHVEFAGLASDGTPRLIKGKDWVNNDSDPTDDDGHGTHTTGTMVGTTVGVAGIAGAAAKVKVYVQKVCGPGGCPSSAIADAIRAAADYPGMVAMNLSLGGVFETSAEKSAIRYAVRKNVLVIASAGNDGTSRVSCPACDPNAISVAATNWRDGLTYYSNYGSGLDISAPGGEIYSNTTWESGVRSAYPAALDAGYADHGDAEHDGYALLQGTSMAAPQVTGTAGVVASVTGLRGSALRNRLQSTADDLGAAGYDTRFGYGRLNSYRAVTNTSLAPGLQRVAARP